MLRVAVAIQAAVLLAPTALGQTAYVPFEQSERMVTFVDVGEIKRNGEEIELRVLEFQTRSEADPIAYTTTLTTVRYSCDWGTYVRLDRVTRDPDGADITGNTIRVGGPPFFFGPNGWHAAAGPVVCNAAAQRPTESFPSFAAAVAEGKRRTIRPPAPKATASRGPVEVIEYSPPPPFSIPNFASPSPSEFGIVVRDPVSGNAHYLDWANRVRKGDIVHVLTVDALGVGKPGPLLMGRLKLNSVEINCASGSVTVLAYVPFGGGLGQEHPQDTRWPTRTAQNWRLGGMLIDKACSGEKPVATLSSLKDVLELQQRFPGTHPPG